MPVLDHAIEDSTDIFGISGGGVFEHPKPPLCTPLDPTSLFVFIPNAFMKPPQDHTPKNPAVKPPLFTAVKYLN